MDFYARTFKTQLEKAFEDYPLVLVFGPFQAGKTGIVRSTFPQLPYVSLLDPGVQAAVKQDPQSFLASYGQGGVIDDIQAAPELFFFLRQQVKKREHPGQFILIGSQNFIDDKKETLTSDGLMAVLTLLPLSVEERGVIEDVEEQLWKGGYPALHQSNLNPADYYATYVTSYRESVKEQVCAVGQASQFERFLRLCATYAGQILNYASLAEEAGVSQEGAQFWLNLLKASNLIWLQQPDYRNFNKRLTESPKLYFTDSGLVCYLLGIESPDHLRLHPSKGAIFENFILSEIMKFYHNHRQRPAIYFFWRDRLGHEVDCILEVGNKILSLDTNPGRGLSPVLANQLSSGQNLAGIDEAVLIYGGVRSHSLSTLDVVPWSHLHPYFRSKI